MAIYRSAINRNAKACLRLLIIPVLAVLTGCSSLELLSLVERDNTCEIAFTVYSEGRSTIHIISDDGRSHRILDIMGEKPVWSPDGNRLAFFGDVPDELPKIYVIDLDNTVTHSFEIYVSSFDSYLRWAEDGNRIFVKTLADLSWIDIEGDSYQEPILWNNGTLGIWFSDLSNNESDVVFDRSRDDGIYVLSLSDKEARLLVSNGVRPVWSPDGNQIAFMRRNGEQADIYIMNADGSDVRNLTLHQSNNVDFDWSPDGSKIVFLSDRDGLLEIYIMDTNGIGVQRLTQSQWNNSRPQWSPAGTRIAFINQAQALFGRTAYRIGIMNSDGTDLRYLPFEGLISDFDWSPNCN